MVVTRKTIMANYEAVENVVEDEKTTPEAVVVEAVPARVPGELSEERKAELSVLAEKAAERRLQKELEAAFLADEKKKAYEAIRPKKASEDLISIVIDLPDCTGLNIDGRVFQHNKEYVVPRSEFDNMRSMIALSWRADRELSNPYSGSKFYRPTKEVRLKG